MAVFKKIKGIIGDLFQLGISDTAHAIKDHTDGVAILANDGTTPANAVIARPQGVNQNTHAAAYLDVKERVIDIEFNFDGGGVVPPPGTNTGKYGICHTAGGGYGAGTIYFDDGATLSAVPMYQGICCSPRTAFTGTVSMVSDGLYLAEGTASPWSWTIKGDVVQAYNGIVQAIEIAFGFADWPGPKSSTTSVPENARVIRSIVKVTAAFTGGSTLLIEVDGAAIDTVVQSTTDNRLTKINQYDVVDEIPIPAGEGGPVRLTFGGAAVAGAGTALIEYVLPWP